MNAMMFLQRHELRRLGFYFASEETVPEGILQLPAWSQPLVVHAVGASSTDAHDQGPQNLLRDDNQFWSSTGSDSQDSTEWLQFRSEGLCCVQAVQIQGFRADFQPGWAEPSRCAIQMSPCMLHTQGHTKLASACAGKSRQSCRCPVIVQSRVAQACCANPAPLNVSGALYIPPNRCLWMLAPQKVA